MIDFRMKARRCLTAALGAALILSLSARAGETAKASEPPIVEPLLAGIATWAVLDEGQTLIVQKDGKLQFCDPASGKLTPIGEEKRELLQSWRIDAQTIAYEVPHGFVFMDLKSGKATDCVTGPGDYMVFGMKPGRDWFMVMVICMEEKDFGFHFHRVDGKTGRSSLIYKTGDKFGVEEYTLADDGGQLLVWTESDKQEELIRRTVDLASLKVKVDRVKREEVKSAKRPAFPLPDGSGRVVDDGNQLVLVRSGKKEALFSGPCRSWGDPDRKDHPRRLAVSRMTDTDGNGVIDRDGDQVEIWMLDLATLQKTQLADANGENIERRWSKDGRYYCFLRWTGVGKRQGDLVVNEPETGKSRTISPQNGADLVDIEDFIDPGWLLVTHHLPPKDNFDVAVYDLPGAAGTSLIRIKELLLLVRGDYKQGYSLCRLNLPARKPAAAPPQASNPETK
jgi:hypothetical protein